MTLLLAAVGATLMALLELSVGPYLQVGLAQPHLVLVVGIVVTVAVGLEAGLVWAFVGGLVLDVIVDRPLGSTSFALLLCVGATAVLASLLTRFRPVVPILATLLLSLFYSMTLFAAYNALRSPIHVADPFALVLPSIVYDTILAALIGPLGDLHPRSTRRSRTGGLVSTFLDERPKPVRSLSRFLTFALIAVIGVTGLTARLFYLQMVDGGRLATLSTRNRTVLEAIQAPRGVIYDRNGRALVSNVPTFVVKLRPADLPLDQRPVVVQRLSALLRMPVADINGAIDGNPGSTFDLVRIASDVDEQTARLISEAGSDLPGVEVVIEARRQYVDGPLMSQILGYTGPISGEQLAELKSAGYLPDDLIGKAGVESVYETELRGVYGSESVERDASGRQTQVLQTVSDAQPGDSLTLTIDTKEQRNAQKALQWAMKDSRHEAGRRDRHEPADG